MSRSGGQHWIHAWPWQWGIAALLAAALRIWLVGRYGILYWPDSSGYSSHAEQILNLENVWQLAAGKSLSNFRMIGYPAFLAVTMAVGGDAWPWLAVAIQILLSLLMLWWLYRLGLAIGFGRGYAAFAAGVFACSHVAIYDGSILTDATATYIFLIAVSALLVPLLERTPVGWVRATICGLLVALTFLIREATLYLAIPLAAGFAVVMSAQHLPRRQIAGILFCFLLPVVIMWQGYAAWNVARTGQRFITTVGQSVYLLHPLQIEMRGTRVFRDPVLRDAADATSSDYAYGHALEINRYLKKRYNLNEWDRTRLSEAAYWDAWRTVPVAMLVEFARELRIKYIVQLADLSMSLRDYPVMGGLEREPLGGFASRLLLYAMRGFSALVFVGCVVGGPLLLLVPAVRGAVPVKIEALVFCWLIFAAMIGMYALIHMEFRYSLPGQAFAIIAGMAVLRHVGLLWKIRMQA
ncbi:MAG: hypothetical protein OJJ21_18355 [Ferrovibrio sp.]|uniref:hypothetical protein n=1 Tax=Ferrovibrio sp. TaxID=1917215 RepID=UPI00261F5DFB|nr:hypothetical protein [Ferrovibrio sp.]MCW0235569.1 hypothetical protein [Ferrovibrio sp.]